MAYSKRGSRSKFYGNIRKQPVAVHWFSAHGPPLQKRTLSLPLPGRQVGDRRANDQVYQIALLPCFLSLCSPSVNFYDSLGKSRDGDNCILFCCRGDIVNYSLKRQIS